jgi:hypothetical protein
MFFPDATTSGTDTTGQFFNRRAIGMVTAPQVINMNSPPRR